MKNTMKYLLLPVVLACAGVAHAQVAGTWMVRAGATHIAPNVTSGDLSAPSLPRTQADIKGASQVSGGITYMVNDHFAIDLPLALPFKNEIVGAGSIEGVGKIADVKALPATLIAQWRFMPPKSSFRPFVGLGLTYASFFGARGTPTLTALTGGTPANPTTLEVSSKFAPTVQAGANLDLGGNWFINGNMTYTPLSATTTLSTGQTQDSKINPASYSVSVGFMF